MTIISGMNTHGKVVKPKKTSNHLTYTVVVHFSFTDDVTDKTYKTKTAAQKRISQIMNSEKEYVDGFSYCSITENII